ncbi:MAG: hypothetical protein F4Y41_02745 [Gammaproteobacteria bacterium]|nr:hypothetical protein [Gammaproteobacteria bacterium]MYF27814.1 hypothetical protein [Gammaproteobacteria bacterium]
MSVAKDAAPGGRCFGILAAGALAGVLLNQNAMAAEEGWNWSKEVWGQLAVESRWFPEGPAWTSQLSRSNGFVASPRMRFESAKGVGVTFSPFYRFDGDDAKRSHADLREASLALWGGGEDGQWELRVGVDRVFWSVVESNHLVDVVNQTDLVEHPDEKARLGQPMVHFSYSADWGVFDLIGLPFHQKRTFPGRNGRLRPRFAVDSDRSTYESGAEDRHVDFAARYGRTFGPMDVGVSGFWGTSREPFLTLGVDQEGTSLLVPHYQQIRQLALDLQLSAGPWLLKLEGVRRAGALNRLGAEEDYAAFVIGGEYAVLSALGSSADVTLVAEWSYDERDRRATTRYENDLFLAMRIAINDFASSELTVSALVGRDHSSRALSLDFNRRIADGWTLRAAAYALLRVDAVDVLHDIRQDSLLELGVTYRF